MGAGATPRVEETIAPRRTYIGRQFSLATLMLIVLGVAGGINLWLFWQPWVVAGDYQNCRVAGFSKDSSKLMLLSSDSLEVDAHNGAVVARPSFKAAGAMCVSPRWDRTACFLGMPAHIDIYNNRSGVLEQTLECGAFGDQSHFSADGELLIVSSSWSVCAYRRGQSEPEWSIDALQETEAAEDESTTSAKKNVEDDWSLREAERSVGEAMTVNELEARVEKLSKIPHGSSHMNVLLSPCTDLAVTSLVTAAGARASSWNLATGRRNAELEGFFAGEEEQFAFSEDGRCLGAVDPANGKVFVWDLATGHALAAWKVSDTPLPAGRRFPLDKNGSLMLSCGGRVAAIQTGSNTQLWDCSAGRLITELAGIRFLAFSPNSERLIGMPLAERTPLVLFDTETGARLFTLPAPLGECGTTVTYAGDGRSMSAVGMSLSGSEVKLFSRQHPESALGLLALPGSWTLFAVSLLLVWRFVRALARRRARISAQ